MDMKELRQKDKSLKRLFKINSLSTIILFSVILSLFLTSSSVLPSSLLPRTLLAFKPSPLPSESTSPQTSHSNPPAAPYNQGLGEGSTSGPSVGCGYGTDNSTCNQSSNSSSQSSTTSDQSGGANNVSGFDTNQGSTDGNEFGNSSNPSIDSGSSNQPPPQQGTNGIAGPPTSYLQYRSPNFGFGIQYPATSQISERQNGAIFFSGGNAIFVLLQNVNNMGLSDFTQYNVNKITQTFPTARNGVSGDSSLAGYPSHYLDFITPTGVLASVSWIVVGNTGYQLGFFFTHPATSSDIAADQKIIHDVSSSFQLGGNQQFDPNIGTNNQGGFGNTN